MINSMFKKGFTLLEMIIVVVIMGVLASSVIPLYDSKEVKHNAVKNLANQLYLLQEASLNYYIDSNGSGIPYFPDDVQDLIDGGYLTTQPSNPFFPNETDEFTILRRTKSVNSSQVNAGMFVQVTVPNQYVNLLKMYLPQIQSDDTYLTQIEGVDNTSVVTYDKYINGTTQVGVFLPAPGQEASHDNLVHRDSGVIQELRTMHGQLAIVDNTDGSKSRMVVSNQIPTTTDPASFGTPYIDDNGNARRENQADFGSLTVGFVDNNLVGIRGVSPLTSNLVVDAFNPYKGGDAANNFREGRGHVVIGAYESKGVILGGLDITNNVQKPRVLVDDNGMYFAGYNWASGGLTSYSGTGPQWISKITDSGQTWNHRADNERMLARMDSIEGDFRVRKRIGLSVMAKNDTGNDRFRWDNSQANLDTPQTYFGPNGSSIRLLKGNDQTPYSGVDGHNGSGMLNQTSGMTPEAAERQGVLYLRAEGNNDSVSGSLRNHGIITKESKFDTISFLGSILHVGHYACGETINGGADVRTKQVECANGLGVVTPVIMGNPRFHVTGQTFHPLLLDMDTLLASLPSGNTKYVNASIRLYTGSVPLKDFGYKGKNIYIDNNGRVNCQAFVRNGAFTRTGLSSYTGTGTSALRAPLAQQCSLRTRRVGWDTYVDGLTCSGSAQIHGIVAVSYICMPKH